MKMTHNGKTITINDWSYSSKDDVLRVESDAVEVPDVDPVPEDPEYPQPEPDVPDNVIEHYHFDPMKGESNKQILVNPTDTIASKFTAPQSGYGEVKFEFDPTVTGGYKTVRAWISTTPGGEALPRSTKESAMMLSVNWTTAPDHRTKTSLVPGRTYYLNLKQIDASEHGSRLFRFIAPGAKV